MRYLDIEPMIKEIGLPYAYRKFNKTSQAPPYVVYFLPGNDDFVADDCNYQEIVELQIELYTKTKRFDLEADVKAVLKRHGLVYDVTEDYIESDGVIMITYTMEVAINAECE